MCQLLLCNMIDIPTMPKPSMVAICKKAKRTLCKLQAAAAAQLITSYWQRATTLVRITGTLNAP